jgi:hypothetical protein
MNTVSGSLVQAVSGAMIATIEAARLTAAISISAPAAPVGQTLQVTLTVGNAGGIAANSVTPSLEATAGAALLAPGTGPSPSGPVTLAPADAIAFTWTYLVTGFGSIAFTATVTGTDSGTGGTLSASASGVMTPPSPEAGQVWVTSSSGKMPFSPDRGEMLLLRVNPPKAGRMRIRVYNLLWEEIAMLHDGEVSPGTIEVRWNGRNRDGQSIAAGLYMVRIETPGQPAAVKKILVSR